MKKPILTDGLFCVCGVVKSRGRWRSPGLPDGDDGGHIADETPA
ncbi:MAG: hypothetical protein ACK5JN_21620 [Kluyvera sp.]